MKYTVHLYPKLLALYPGIMVPRRLHLQRELCVL